MEIEVIDLEFQGHRRTIASFLVRGPEGVILIESGPESCRENLLMELSARDIDPEDLCALFVTHVHLDHAGAAGWFAARGVPVFVHPKGAKHLVNPTRLVESARAVYGDRFDSLWGEMVPGPGESIREIADGEKQEVAGLVVEAIDTPGHAFHHHAYAIEDSIFAGDSSGARIDGSGFISVTSAPPQFDLECTLSSIDLLRARGESRLFLTHFGEIGEPQNHWAAYREAVELNATFVKQRLDEGMDEDSLRIAYQAFQMEQAFRFEMPRESWAILQEINGTDMCADGIRMYWQRKAELDRS
ncbi:MAG: MBL fold metallo-hydrolase [Verrucomicrobiales bacterium]|nr:MBL fold metallo-hydrolase [Verrucomicrobiales bacterium]